MIGKLFCRLWAHKWSYMFTNGSRKGVFYCQRCMKVDFDR